MDRLVQGTDEKTGRQFVLFARYKITTLPDGEWEVLDERDGGSQIYADRAAALDAAGVPAEFDARPAESAIVRVQGLISRVEAKALDAVAAEQGLTTEAVVRRAVAEYLLRHM